MAYKNQKKNKAHVVTLQNKDWRKANKVRKKKSKQMDMLRNIGVGSSEMDDMMKMMDSLNRNK